MRLVSFSVENYRSITKAKQIDVSQSTVLVGPNNEGKSNLVRGLALAMQTLREARSFTPSGRIVGINVYRISSDYVWKKDFPVALRTKQQDGETTFVLDFELDVQEIADFKKATKSDLNGRLSIQLAFGPTHKRAAVLKQGRGARTLTSKATIISQFIRDRIQVEYIPAIRTADSAERVVDSLVERELAVIEDDPTYDQALRAIAELQKPILAKLSEAVRDTMVKFLPAIKDVRFVIPEEKRSRALRRSASLVIDDGTPTELRYKGDGVQSLAALALTRHASERAASGRNFVIVVEEPESHLHPKAMHSLKSVLQELRARHQVVITTHSPLFVDRTRASANIIVNKNKARAASSIAEVREVLGVRASDNLQLAEVVLIVEGEDDKVAVQALIHENSAALAESLDSGKLALESLNGGSNLGYKAGMLRDALLCVCHAFMDADKAGKEAVRKAIAQGVLSAGEINYASAMDLKGESELEDLYDPHFYRDLVRKLYSVDISTNPKFNNNKKKWSDRMFEAFQYEGKPWDDSIKAGLKAALAQHVAQNPQNALHPYRSGTIKSLVAALEGRCLQEG